MSRAQTGMWGLVVTACLVLAVTTGAIATRGLFVSPINTTTGLGIATVSFAAAVGALMWGAWQPVFGALADRHGAGIVIAVGALLLALGSALMPHMPSAIGLVFSMGILSSAGAAAGSMSVLMGAIGQRLPPETRGLASGIVNAGGSVGQLVLAPVFAVAIATYGWASASYGLALVALATLPLALPFKRRATAPGGAVAAAPAAGPPDLRAALREATGSASYWYLMGGFFVCGFHISFLMTHMPGVIELCGLPPSLAGTSLGVIGLFNIAGSILAGLAAQRWSMKIMLALLYASRGVGVALFLAAPKTELTILLFSAWMGVTFLATVPPTVGLVGKLFGTRYLATLFGVTLLAHQVGGFFGAWFGGLAFEATGGYDWMWYADMALAVFAALINLPIREPRAPRLAHA
ncbi:MAG: MFS transporter [Burkholderiales bacterium]|nr:MFS transporter [Burkholderiales bacterium]